MNRFACFILTFILLAIGGVLRAQAQIHTPRTYYVDTTGNDRAAGNQTAPWATLQRTVTALLPGDTVIVRKGNYAGFVAGWESEGEYRPISGTATAPITIKADPDAPPGSVIISQRNNKTEDGIDLEGDKGNVAYVIINGFTVTGPTIVRAGIRIGKSTGVQVLNCTLKDCGTWGIFTSHTTDCLLQGNSTSGAKRQHGIYVSNSAVRPIVRGNIIFDNGDEGIHLNGDLSQGGSGVTSHALIEDNVIYHNTNNGINCDGIQDSVIRNNLLYDNGKHGIMLYKIDAAAGSKNNLIVNNTIIVGPRAGWAIGIKNNSTGNTIYNNVLYNLNGGHGSVNIAPDSLDGLTSDYNALDGRFSNDDDTIRRLDSWQTKTGQDKHSILAVPAKLFINAASGDLRPGPGGPLIGAGRKPPLPATIAPETFSIPSDNVWDIGAHPPENTIPTASVINITAAVRQPLIDRKLAVSFVQLGFLAILAMGGMVIPFRSRGLHRWIGSYCRQFRRLKSPAPGEPVHLLLCITDHYEPHNGGVSDERANARVDHWSKQYPAVFGQFRDSDGRPPRHTFFYPIEQYNADHVEAITALCRAGFGEVEVHLHHDNDTSENLRNRLEEGKQRLSSRHGLLARDRRTGELAYAFIHGDWALDNSAPGGHFCGVNNELDILRETGCYADFTLPSAPSLAQTTKINSIYYAIDDPIRPMSHNTGLDVGHGPRPENSLLLIQGPLLFNWNRRKWGLVPRVENGCLQNNQQASMARLDIWLQARVQVPQRPDWFFVKLHAHGANEDGQRALLGPGMQQFHRDLAERSRQQPNFQYHYVTAREMYNLARAAEAGWKGSVADARNYELVSNFSELERKKTA